MDSDATSDDETLVTVAETLPDDGNAQATQPLQAPQVPLPKNAHDPEDMGETPSTVKRRCTDWLWILPWVLCLSATIWISWYSTQHSNIENLYTSLDFVGYKCGARYRPDAPYLYFCRSSDTGPERDTLNTHYPICVSECPNSTDTKTRCFVGKGNAIAQLREDTKNMFNWNEVSDYPSWPMANVLCRPDKSKVPRQIWRQWRHTVRKTSPPNIRILVYAANWRIVLWPIGSSMIFSIIYILLLSRFARMLVWGTLILLMLVCVVNFAAYTYNYKTGGLQEFMGRGQGTVLDAFLAGINATFFTFLACHVNKTGERLDQGARVLESGCQCILSSPSLILKPLFTSCLRVAMVAWWLTVIFNLYSVHLVGAQTIATHIRYGEKGVPWKFPAEKTPDTWSMQILVTFTLLWVAETDTAAAIFVLFFLGQNWQLQKRDKTPCRVLRAYCLAMRYHSGSLILLAFLQIFLNPIHMVFETVSDLSASTGALGALVETFCCCLGCYRNNIAYLSREAMQDVSLHGMSFFHAAKHYNRENSVNQQVRVLGTEVKFFQLAGLTLAGIQGWAVTMWRVERDEYRAMDSPHFMINPHFEYILFGIVVSVWCSIPFMRTFHLIAEGILYVKFVEWQRQPQHDALMWDNMCSPCHAFGFRSLHCCSSRFSKLDDVDSF